MPLPVIGMRVRRGPEWKWGEPDGNGPGTVIKDRGRGFVEIQWDCGNVGIYKWCPELRVTNGLRNAVFVSYPPRPGTSESRSK